MNLPSFADVNGLSLHYRLSGPPNAPLALVFVNSLGSNFAIWNAVADLLSNQYRVLQYDKRGHGLSDAPPAPYSMRDHTNDLAGLLDTLGIEKVLPIGVSVGGMIAQDFAGAHPERTLGLVLCDTGLKIGSAEMWNERIEAAQNGEISRIAPIALGRWFTPPFFTEQPAAARGYLNMICRTSVDGYAGTCAALRDTDLHKQTAALKVPAVVLCGEGDTSTPPELNRELAEAVGAPLHLIEGAAHIPSVEQPQVVADHIRNFVNSLLGVNSRYEQGMSIRRRVLGDAHVDRASAQVTELDREFQTFITEYAWGGPWSRGVLDTHTRHLITLAVLAALPREHELELHLRATVNTGVTPEELREVLMHIAVYAGVPVSNRALQLAKKVLAEQENL